jgi:hypothetical protein
MFQLSQPVLVVSVTPGRVIGSPLESADPLE